MDEEQRKDKQERARVGGTIKSLTQNKAWREIVLPGLQDRRSSLLKTLIEKNNTYEEFVMLQQAINAIDNLLNYIDVTIGLGEVAHKDLREENKT